MSQYEWRMFILLIIFSVTSTKNKHRVYHVKEFDITIINITSHGSPFVCKREKWTLSTQRRDINYKTIHKVSCESYHQARVQTFHCLATLTPRQVLNWKSLSNEVVDLHLTVTVKNVQVGVGSCMTVWPPARCLSTPPIMPWPLGRWVARS